MASDNGRDRRATFDALFADDRDPWSFETSDYERSKRAATLAALGERRFACALEIGCAQGVLTEQLAPACDTLLAMDISEVALKRASARLAHQPHVQFRQGEIPRAWPEEGQCRPFDLILLSEVLYFLSAEEVERTSIAAHRALSSQGICLLVNWTGPTDLPLGGDAVVRLFEMSAPWKGTLRKQNGRYRLDRYTQRFIAPQEASKPLLI
ncbi:MAG: SAM-dependent methyltransferase [Erythrobacter sp.]|nr:SAM-dependent methyltransferase [Erythrobacter sp.]